MTAAGVGEKLRAIAQELRAHPERWTQGEMARNARGHGLEDGEDETAVCWCSLGLLEREFNGPGGYDRRLRISRIFEALTASIHTADWNDASERTAADVADLFDRAAQLAEASP